MDAPNLYHRLPRRFHHRLIIRRLLHTIIYCRLHIDTAEYIVVGNIIAGYRQCHRYYAAVLFVAVDWILVDCAAVNSMVVLYGGGGKHGYQYRVGGERRGDVDPNI